MLPKSCLAGVNIKRTVNLMLGTELIQSQTYEGQHGHVSGRILSWNFIYHCLV